LEGAVRRLEERPTTADSTDGATGAARAASLRRTTRAQQPGHTYDEMRLDEGLEPEKHGVRPRTSLAGAKDAAKASSLLDFSPPDDASPRGAPPAPPSERSLQKAAQRAVEADARAPPSGVLPRARRIKIRIESTWGDAHYVGLNGVRVLIGDGARPCSLSAAQLTAEPRDLRSLGYLTDPRVLETLVDGEDTTCDDAHMWLVPFDPKRTPWLEVDLLREECVYGVVFCNYNKSEEDSVRGAKSISIFLDGKWHSDHHLRPAPGRCHVDFGQRVLLSPRRAPPQMVRVAAPAISPDDLLGDFETPELPTGSYLRFVLHSTYGDAYYVGLDAIKLLDEAGNAVQVEPRQVSASPHSCRSLGAAYATDARLPENLLCGDGCWLAPNRVSLSGTPGEALLPEENEVYVFLEERTRLSQISITNYTKTRARGVGELSVWLDGLLLARVRLRAQEAPQHLLFGSTRFKALRDYKVETQDVLCIDENTVKVKSKNMFETDPCAEGVFQAMKTQRPTTAFQR